MYGGAIMQIIAYGTCDLSVNIPVFPFTRCWICGRKKQGRCKRKTCNRGKISNFYEELRIEKEKRIAKRLKIKNRKHKKK